MLNIFPRLLDLSFIAPFILRAVLGLLIIRNGVSCLISGEGCVWDVFGFIKNNYQKLLTKIVSFGMVVCGLFLIAGLFTQVFAGLVVVSSVITLAIRTRIGEGTKMQSYGFYFLILAISLSLMFTGAGAFAIDLPL